MDGRLVLRGHLLPLLVAKEANQRASSWFRKLRNEEKDQERTGLAFSLVPTMHVLMSEVVRPEQEGYGVIDSGAAETVGGLDALECVHRRRTAKLGHSNHVHVMQEPSKNFRF